MKWERLLSLFFLILFHCAAQTITCSESFTCTEGHFCCPNGLDISHGICCHTNSTCTYASPEVQITLPTGELLEYGCCDYTGQNVCSMTYNSQSDIETPCCFPNQTCCGLFCCTPNEEMCCYNQPYFSILGPICLLPTDCCSSNADCPSDSPCCESEVNFNTCCGTTCCNGTCCIDNNSTYCCAKGNCGPSLSCACDTKNPNDNVCSSSINPTTGIPTSVCCSQNCCGPVCCPTQQTCCLNQTDNTNICLPPGSCCGGKTCDTTKKWYCCQSNQCVNGVVCVTGFVDGVNFVIAYMSLLWFVVMLAGVGVLLFLCCLCCCLRNCKCVKKEEEEDNVNVKQMEDDLKKLQNQNKVLEKKNNKLLEEKNHLENIKEEKEQLEYEMEKIEALKEENQRLANENKILLDHVKVSDTDTDNLGPIELVFFGGAFLQEKIIFAPPTKLMGNIIENFCTDNTLKRLEFAFYSKPRDKKVYVDETKTAHENGFINGTRILYEKAADNKLWKKKVDSSE